MSSIDPRLRQRRIAVRRAEGRRRLRILVGVLGLAAVLGGGYALSQSAVLDLDTIEVAGAAGADAAAVAEATGLDIGTPLIELDLDDATAAVTALPWVETAAVSRAWPGTVEVTVTRRIGVALLPTGDGTGVVIDDDGVAIARSATSAVGDLPVITLGPSGDLGDVQTLALPALDLIAAVPADLEPWIETYDIDYGGVGTPALTLDLVGDAVAQLGDDRELDAKLESVRTTLGRVDLTCVSIIDARVGGYAVVTRDDACEAASPGGDAAGTDGSASE
ncbi:MAG: FtsQ-type POTRA domain-containing protein [Actinomycetota bacterium]